MVGRPERSDPDELTYNLFVSANAANGYDFVGYKNPDYDKLAQEQREELDLDKRKALIIQAQELINHDQPYGFEVASVQRRRLQQDGLGSEQHGLAGRHRHPQHLDLDQHHARSARRRT